MVAFWLGFSLLIVVGQYVWERKKPERFRKSNKAEAKSEDTKELATPNNAQDVAAPKNTDDVAQAV